LASGIRIAGGVKNRRAYRHERLSAPAEIAILHRQYYKEAVLDKIQEHLTVNGC
jgi:hypothetical protein